MCFSKPSTYLSRVAHADRSVLPQSIRVMNMCFFRSSHGDRPYVCIWVYRTWWKIMCENDSARFGSSIVRKINRYFFNNYIIDAAATVVAGTLSGVRRWPDWYSQGDNVRLLFLAKRSSATSVTIASGSKCHVGL